MGSDDFEFVVNAECGLARGGACLFSLWRGRPELLNVRGHYAVADAILTKYPRFGLMLVIEPNARPPSVAAFGEIEAFYTRYGDRIACLAQVLEATGFVSSAARSAMAAILLRKSFAAKVFANTSDAIPWIATSLAPSPSEAQQTGKTLAVDLSRARSEHTFQPKPSAARLSHWPPSRK